MTEERPEAQPDEPETEAPEIEGGEEAPGEAELERRLAEPILKGHEGLDTAQVWIGAFIVVIAGIVAYSNAFNLPIHFEDRAFFEESGGVPRLVALGAALEARPAEPLAVAAMAVNRWLGESPRAFHGVNIALHLAGAVLVYLLCRRLLGSGAPVPAAMLAGLLFALHPINGDAVNYIIGRGLLLGLVFAVLSVLLFLRATDTERVEPGSLAGSLLCLILAWASTPLVLPLPLLVIAADRILRGESTGTRSVAGFAYGAVFLALLTAHTVVFATSEPVSEVHVAPLAARLEALGGYYLRTLYPYGLSAYHPLDEAARFTSPVLWGGVLVTAVLAALGLYLVARRSLGGFALLWYVLFAVTAALLAPPDEVMQERMVYLPLVGAALALPWLFSLVPPRPALRTGLGLAAAVLVLIAGVGAFIRNQVWQSEEGLWSNVALRYPESPQPHRVVGDLYLNEGLQAMTETAFLQAEEASEQAGERRRAALERFEAAEAQFRAAREKSDEPEPEILFRLAQTVEYRGQLGDAEGRRERLEEAADLYRATLEADPEHGDALVRLAFTLENLAGLTGDRSFLVRAVDYYGRARELDVLPPEMYARYGQGLAAMGAYERARSVLAEAAELQPQGTASSLLEPVNAAEQNLAQLQQAAGMARQQAPGSSQALGLWGRLLAFSRHDLQASYLFESALAQDPRDADAWMLLGVTRGRLGAAERFVAEWPNPPLAADETGSPWRRLARATASAGAWDGARVYLEAAARSGDPQVRDPELALGDIAVEIGAAAQADEYLRRYAEAHPNDPTPWLRLADLALANNDEAGARSFLAEAARRNAPESELAKRRGNRPQAPAEPTGPFMLR